MRRSTTGTEQRTWTVGPAADAVGTTVRALHHDDALDGDPADRARLVREQPERVTERIDRLQQVRAALETETEATIGPEARRRPQVHKGRPGPGPGWGWGGTCVLQGRTHLRTG